MTDLWRVTECLCGQDHDDLEEIHDDCDHYEERPVSNSEVLSAVLSLPGVEIVEMHPCCMNHEGKPMCSPSGVVVSGNGECAEFLLSAGRYAIIPIPETP